MMKNKAAAPSGEGRSQVESSDHSVLGAWLEQMIDYKTDFSPAFALRFASDWLKSLYTDAELLRLQS
uniref:Uncharacterized protein n=2 Tax=Helianthus annuus TaxID=4232 RepID=A0A251RVS3_HELAN